ncbi:MAG TPA: hypothetical protein PK605_07415 [Ignavibacteria bacterium]|nr:hypothetical protein [Bacteroidota bacterium]HRE11110.1 hypothetical protein [Ignavibacteria bacterium]HRF65905.1 hypothetical protein [Ignavibacteria bacterium]HRJ04215.1 hypothetical protein [Ignavibacteria bacterium]
MNTKMNLNRVKLFASLAVLFLIVISCSKLQNLTGGDRLYFCEKYTTKEIGEGTKFTTGTITVMLKLSKPIGVTSVDVNVTDVATGKPVETFPFTVQSSWDYIHFDDVEFKEPGKYKVSCLKKDGTVIASNEVEITSK